MTTQDLSNNRDRIIKNIKSLCSTKEAVAGVMNKMVAWLASREDIKSMKATKANIDKFTTMCANSWLKNDFKPVVTEEWLKQREQKVRESHSNFY